MRMRHGRSEAASPSKVSWHERPALTVIRDVSTKLLWKWLRAFWASSSDLKPMKPNLRNLPSLVNLRLQSVSVPKAENSCRNRSSFIYSGHSARRGAVGSPDHRLLQGTECSVGSAQVPALTSTLSSRGALSKYHTHFMEASIEAPLPWGKRVQEKERTTGLGRHLQTFT